MATQPCHSCPCFAMHEKVDQKGVAGGYSPLDTTALIPVANLGTGAPGPNKYLSSDREWVEVTGGSGLSQAQVLARGLGI